MLVSFCTGNAVHSFSCFLLYRKLSLVHIISYSLSLSHVALVFHVSCAQMYQARASSEESRLMSQVLARTGLSRMLYGRAWSEPWASWLQDDDGQFYVNRCGLSTEGFTEGLTNVAVNFLNIGQRQFSKKN
jgi:hypothetical protein